MLMREAPRPLHVVGMQLDDGEGGAGARARGNHVPQLQLHRLTPLGLLSGGAASGGPAGATEARPARISLGSRPDGAQPSSLPAEERSRLELAGSSSHFAPLPRLNEGVGGAVAPAALTLTLTLTLALALALTPNP